MRAEKEKAQSMDKKIDYIPRFASLDFALADCKTLTGGVNFSGKRVGDED